MDPGFEYDDRLAYELRIGRRVRRKQFPALDQFADELCYFSKCILEDLEPGPSGSEGLADLRVIDGMMKSFRTGRWTRLLR